MELEKNGSRVGQTAAIPLQHMNFLIDIITYIQVLLGVSEKYCDISYFV